MISTALTILSFGLAVIFAALYYLRRKDITDMADELSSINKESTNRRITVGGRDGAMSRLAEEINKSIDKSIEAEAAYIRADSELRNAIADMSHDLRTPLTSIMGYLQLIRDGDVGPADKAEYLGIVERRAVSLQNLICSFYDLSRLQAGEYRFEYKSINMGNMLEDITASFYNDFVNRGIEPSIDIDMSTPKVIADENAVARIYQTVEGDCLKTVFTNDCENMTEEDAVRIFDRFFTADRMRTGQNTGLGLAITRELTEQMGHIVSSEYADGCLSVIIRWKIADSMKNQ